MTLRIERADRKVSVRLMHPDDYAAVAEIERLGWPGDPLDAEAVRWLMESSQSNGGYVATKGRTIAGHVLWQQRRKKIGLISIAVHPRYVRQGVGTALLAWFPAGIKLVADVPEEMLHAQIFFRGRGFRAAKILHDHCGEGCHCYRMVRRAWHDADDECPF